MNYLTLLDFFHQIMSMLFVTSSFISNRIPEIIMQNPNLSFFLVALAMFLLSKLLTRQPFPNVFLLDFACYKPQNGRKQILTHKMVVERCRYYRKHNEETLGFMQRLLERSGLGDSTYLPESLTREPPTETMEEARKETEDVMFGAIDDVLAKTGVRTEDIGIVIVNCCLFNVAPSLSSMIVNKYKLRDNVKNYNLGGMGCSAGLRAIDLARNLLQVNPNTYALVLSTENITENVYRGNNKSMVVTNCVFRVGGAAILLTNRPADRPRCKYQLLHSVHTHTARFDRSYNCIQLEDDPDQVDVTGVTINKDLVTVAIKTIEANLTVLGRMILPARELLLFLTNRLVRSLRVAKVEPYVPSFKNAVDHIISHVGAKPVLDGLQSNLGFSESQLEPSRMTLYRFGNTSSSSVWYGLAYAEAKQRVKMGDRVWHIAMGSGFKCSSLIWKALRTIGREEKNPWADEIDQFPVNLKKIERTDYFD